VYVCVCVSGRDRGEQKDLLKMLMCFSGAAGGDSGQSGANMTSLPMPLDAKAKPVAALPHIDPPPPDPPGSHKDATRQPCSPLPLF